MKTVGLALVLGVTALAGSGCATWASDTAPAPDGQSIYVAGRRANPAALWICPDHKTGDDCREVDVELRD